MWRHQRTYIYHSVSIILQRQAAVQTHFCYSECGLNCFCVSALNFSVQMVDSSCWKKQKLFRMYLFKKCNLLFQGVRPPCCVMSVLLVYSAKCVCGTYNRHRESGKFWICLKIWVKRDNLTLSGGRGGDLSASKLDVMAGSFEHEAYSWSFVKVREVACWPQLLSRYDDLLRAVRSEDRIPMGVGFFRMLPDLPWGRTSLL